MASQNSTLLVLVAAIALSRGLDFLSTWIATPRLSLEANPLMRRVRWWPMALLNLPLLALPFLHQGLSVTFIVTSFLAAGANLTASALARGMGEDRQLEQQRAAIRRIGLARALGLNTFGALVVCAGGGFMMWLAPSPGHLAWWGALGVAMYGLTGLVHFNIAIFRLNRHGRQRPPPRRP